jgi:quercetin dioxygenase-like cupin family protein
LEEEMTSSKTAEKVEIRESDHAPEIKHIDDMDWELSRFGTSTKFLFHPDPDRPTAPNAGLVRHAPGEGFPLHRHDFAQVWYVLEGEYQFGDKTLGPGSIVYMPDPHFEYEMNTETGGTMLYVQYPGPTTGAAPLYQGRMNLEKPESSEEQDLNV